MCLLFFSRDDAQLTPLKITNSCGEVTTVLFQKLFWDFPLGSQWKFSLLGATELSQKKQERLGFGLGGCFFHMKESL